MRFSAIFLLAEAVSTVVISSNTIVSANYPTADITVNLGVFYTIINPAGQFTGSLNIAGELFFVASGQISSPPGVLLQLSSFSNTGTIVFENLVKLNPVTINIKSNLFSNSGTMFMAADTSTFGGYSYSLGSAGTWQNTGTILVVGSSLASTPTLFVAASVAAENSGAICFRNASFFPGNMNVNSGGCINLGAGGSITISDGFLLDQTIYMSDTTSTVSVSVTANPCMFSIGGFTGSNKIIVFGTSPTVLARTSNLITALYVTVGGYTCSFSLLGYYPGNFGFLGSRLTYLGTVPTLNAPSTCSCPGSIPLSPNVVVTTTVFWTGSVTETATSTGATLATDLVLVQVPVPTTTVTTTVFNITGAITTTITGLTQNTVLVEEPSPTTTIITTVTSLTATTTTTVAGSSTVTVVVEVPIPVSTVTSTTGSSSATTTSSGGASNTVVSSVTTSSGSNTSGNIGSSGSVSTSTSTSTSTSSSGSSSSFSTVSSTSSRKSGADKSTASLVMLLLLLLGV
ncbi:hypothetical protein PUMCH_000576 [Australozyma saopauloensis]|uniref:Hyphally-regulated cell wall protein N-terminal domain-containing protein n=1 Tax=Australozyma saopauloensis TaxID=291208 RepID=A0AAX4H4C2_9ASCO|nr:hypothetical protein PUMCH_000576 [[Candida] saopauloensis]